MNIKTVGSKVKTVGELIKLLEQCPSEAEVKIIYEYEGGAYYESIEVVNNLTAKLPHADKTLITIGVNYQLE